MDVRFLRESRKGTLAIASNSYDWAGVGGEANDFSYSDDFSVGGGTNCRVGTHDVIARPDSRRGGSDRGMGSVHVVMWGSRQVVGSGLPASLVGFRTHFEGHKQDGASGDDVPRRRGGKVDRFWTL